MKNNLNTMLLDDPKDFTNKYNKRNFRTISLKYDDFVQTQYQSEKKTVYNIYTDFTVEKYRKNSEQEDWDLTIKGGHRVEIVGDYFLKSCSTNSSFKIETERNFIFWRKKIISDFYSFGGSTEYLKNEIISDILLTFQTEGIEINKEGQKIHFRFYINTVFDDNVFENIVQLIQLLSQS